MQAFVRVSHLLDDQYAAVRLSERVQGCGSRQLIQHYSWPAGRAGKSRRAMRVLGWPSLDS